MRQYRRAERYVIYPARTASFHVADIDDHRTRINPYNHRVAIQGTAIIVNHPAADSNALRPRENTENGASLIGPGLGPAYVIIIRLRVVLPLKKRGIFGRVWI
jgi:hypothetical protein